MKSCDELMAQRYDPTYGTNLDGEDKEIDPLLERFNERLGLLGELN